MEQQKEQTNKTGFNWGHGIFLFYTVFVIAVISVLIASRGVDHSLVTNDYYAKDLAYQSHYEKMINNRIEGALSVDHKDEDRMISFQFKGNESIIGHITFYRPADQSLDFTVTIDPVQVDYNSRQINISTEKMKAGKWIVKTEWKMGHKSYYNELDLYI